MRLSVSTNRIGVYLELVSLYYERNTNIVFLCNRALQLLCCQQLTARISVKYSEYQRKDLTPLMRLTGQNTATKYFEPSKAHSQRREKRLLTSSCLSVRSSICPIISALLPLDRLTWNLMSGIFMKICRAHLNIIKIRHFTWRLN